MLQDLKDGDRDVKMKPADAEEQNILRAQIALRVQETKEAEALEKRPYPFMSLSSNDMYIPDFSQPPPPGGAGGGNNNNDNKQQQQQDAYKQTVADIAFEKFVMNLVGALTKNNKTLEKKKQLVVLHWKTVGERKIANEAKTEMLSVPINESSYMPIKDARDFNDNMHKLFQPAGYKMVNTALTYIQRAFPEHYSLLTPYDHISEHMDVFTNLCVALNRVNDRTAHGINDSGLVVQQGQQTIRGCLSYYRDVFRRLV
jgi:hypothetical protein